jgi:DNA/RNA-binding domain of Phe-tRNA-synthetase-like protein
MAMRSPSSAMHSLDGCEKSSSACQFLNTPPSAPLDPCFGTPDVTLEKGEALPAILPAVDINNLWSVELMVPCCVVDPGKLSGPLTLRKGQPGETMESMRGPFNLEGKPTLVDSEGPFGTPITDSERVKVRKREGTFWLLAYLPKDVVTPEKAKQKLEEIVTRVGCAELRSA